MTPEAILAAIAGPAGALAVLIWGWWLFTTGRICPRSAMEDKDRQLLAKDREIAEWKAAYAAERSRADAGVLAAQTTSTILAALHREVSQ